MMKNAVLIVVFIFLEGLVAQEIPPIKHYKSQIAFGGLKRVGKGISKIYSGDIQVFKKMLNLKFQYS